MAAKVTVQGLRELKRELKKLEGAFPKELQRANKRVTRDIIVPAAVSNAEGRSNPKWGHEAIDTIRALATQEKAQVALGSARVKWAAGENFGSNRFKQFPPSKGYRQGDYALYEAIGQKQAESLNEWVESLDGLLSRAFPT